MQSRERHHALCTPADADAYAQKLIEEFDVTLETAARYWGDVEKFYRWMFHHTDYPHRYHPFVMAAAAYEPSRALWEEKVTRG
ncbi:hypothetical protein [Haloarchaeobius amylolyticus]|uniref:hypothetical protein n=1 Tax=Haloarchaeobius amylolyticus TaxID=1198296 RepID=UPI00226F5A26|nr:hypothetical protein [Haloarchaeobius amylolyticus]